MDMSNLDLRNNDVFNFNIRIDENILQKVKEDILGNVVNFNFFIL